MDCLKYTFVICLLTVLQSCGGSLEENGKVATAVPFESEKYDTTLESVQSLKHFFHIEKETGNGYYLQSYIYLSDQSKLKDVNRYLLTLYTGRHSVSIDIWYFDKKNFVNKYLSNLDNKSISDNQFYKMDKHMICEYSQQGENNGEYDYNNATGNE